VHVQGFVPIQQAPSMFLCSSFSIAAGGSLGPEAPLLGGCGFLQSSNVNIWQLCSCVNTHAQAQHFVSIHACPAALCAASTSWLGRTVLGYDGARLRNCALIGMAAGLAAFFGVSLGGEIQHSTPDIHLHSGDEPISPRCLLRRVPWRCD
jgi:hypothetical protein